MRPIQLGRKAVKREEKVLLMIHNQGYCKVSDICDDIDMLVSARDLMDMGLVYKEMFDGEAVYKFTELCKQEVVV